MYVGSSCCCATCLTLLLLCSHFGEPMFRLSAAALLAMLIATLAVAAPQTFVSKATKGSMDEFSRISLTRDCTDLQNEPYISCTKQEIQVKDKTGKVVGKFPDNQIPKLPNGIHRINLASVFVIDEDLGGGDRNRYFLFRFVPRDYKEIDVLPSGQMFPKYYEVITDMNLRPLMGMRLSANGTAAKWLNIKRKESDKKLKANEIDSALDVNDYLVVMHDR